MDAPGEDAAGEDASGDVGMLARRLGITSEQALALCKVSGIQAWSDATPLTAEQMEHARAVLEGRAEMAVAVHARVFPSWMKGVLGLAVVTVVAVLALKILHPFGPDGALAGDDIIDAEECFNQPDGVERPSPVPCDGPHRYRAFAVIDIGSVYGDLWPGPDDLLDQAERCERIPEAAQLDVSRIWIFIPATPMRWEDPNDRRVICAVPE